MERTERILRLLPENYRAHLEKQGLEDAEELRLRLGHPPTLLLHGREKRVDDLACVSSRELQYVLNRATSDSPYAHENEISGGYVTAPGGIRIGLCGNVRSEGGCWASGGLTSVNIRIPRERIGCADWLIHCPPVSAIVLSPPGGGKTTLLRDWIRILGGQNERVGVCDERGELAGFDGKEFSFSIGEHTDVMTGCAKCRAAMILLRTMDPTVLVMDEITSREDIAACMQAAHCGVRVIAAAHAAGREDLERRGLYKGILTAGIFERIIYIEVSSGHRQYREETI